MTTHELAAALLAAPDIPVCLTDIMQGREVLFEVTYIQPGASQRGCPVILIEADGCEFGEA